MAELILLNGPPASGKSTIAQHFADSRPFTLNLDLDVVRSMLGDWLENSEEAGLRARSLALAMAEAHLLTGRDVIVPQFLGQASFIDQLSEIAARSEATFTEMALWMDRAEAVAAFAERRASPSTQSHYDAAALVDRSEQDDPVGQMYDAFVQLIEHRPVTRRIDVARGDIDLTFARFIEALEIAPS